MAKLKLNLPNGSVEEKNLLTAFKNNEKSYIVFDADSVGSMGLPIILVCKYDNNRVIKINDANEWTEVKGALKEIITGASKDYFSLPETLDVDETYYTQLTLPVASFEAIKKAYVPSLDNVSAPSTEPVQEAAPMPVDNTATQENAVDSNPLMNETIETPEVPTMDPVPSADSVAAPVLDTAAPVEEAAPVEDNSFPTIETQPSTEPAMENPVMDIPSVDSASAPTLETPAVSENNPVVNEKPMVNEPFVEESPIVNEEPATPEVDNIISETTNASMGDAKERFMKACGEAFDALLEVLNKK